MPPLLCAMGFLVSEHGQLGAIPPPSFLRVFPLGGEHAKWRGAVPHEDKANGCDTPLCDEISKKGGR